jgi:KDO2-lipid IV(A) lauroyltransferase
VKRKLRRWLALLLVKTLIMIARILPRRAGLALFSRAGVAAFRFYSEDRERALENLALAFPGTDPMIIRAMAKGSFAALGRNAFDALKLTYLKPERVLELCAIDGEHHLKEAIERGSGVIALSGHIGCWELIGGYLSATGYRVNVIARDLHDKRMNDILVNIRLRHGVVSVPRGSSAVAAYRVLKRGEILGMLIDQDIDVDGVMVPFFGIPAHTPRGAAVFALRSGADIVPMAVHMQPDGEHRITILPPLEFPPEGLGEEQRIDRLTELCSEALERLIRIYPQQWVWFHDRWRRSGEKS